MELAQTGYVVLNFQRSQPAARPTPHSRTCASSAATMPTARTTWKKTIHEKSAFPVNPGYVANDIAPIRVKGAFQLDKTRQLVQLFRTSGLANAAGEINVTCVECTNATLIFAAQVQVVNLPFVDKDVPNEAYRYSEYGGVMAWVVLWLSMDILQG